MITWLTRFPIRTRMILLVAAGLIVTLHVVGTLSAQALRGSTQAVFDERLRLAQLAAHHIDDHVSHVLTWLERAARSEGFDLTDADLQPERQALRELFATRLFSLDVFVTDARGVVLLTDPDLSQVVGTDLSAHPHIQQALATGQPQVSGLLTAIATGQPQVSFVVPVVDEAGTVVGLIGGAANPASPSFAGNLDVLLPTGTGHSDVVDEDGMVLASTDPAHILRQSHHWPFHLTLLPEMKAEVGVYPVVEEGVERGREVVAFAPLSVARWAVCIEQPEAEALAPVYAQRQRMFLIGAIALLITIVLIWLATQAVVVPLRQLLAAARRIASGDLETPVPELGPDEVGELGQGLEVMRQRLAAWGQELETAVRERTRQLSALYAVDRVAAQSLDLEEILRNSLDKVLEVLEVEVGGVLLLEPDGGTMTLRVHHGLSEDFVQAVRRIEVGEGISGRAVAEGQPVVLDVRDYPAERLAPFVVKEGLLSLVSTPLVSKGVALGALTLGTRRPRAFPLEALELLAAIGGQLGGAVENAHLFEAERRRAAQLALVADIARRAVAILDPDRLMQETADALQQTFGYYDVILFLVDQEAGEMVLKARAGSFERPFPREPVQKIGQVGILGWVARHGQTLLANDVSRVPRYRAFLPDTRSELCVPVKDGERVVAGINVESDRLYAFDEADVAALEALADELAVALRNAELFAERQRKLTELAALNQVGRALATTLDLDELMEVIYQEVTTVMEADAFFIALYDREADELDYRVRMDMGVREPQERRSPGGISGLIVSSGQPILIRDFERERDQYPQVKLWGTMEAPDSWLGVPMVTGERVVGLISVQAYRPAAYDEGHQALLSTIAAQAALVVENARLFEETRQKSEHLAVINRLDRVISSSLDIREIYQTFVEEVARLVSFDRTAIVLLDEAGEQWEVLVQWTRAEPVIQPGARGAVEGTVLEWLLEHREPWLEGELGEKGEWAGDEMLRREGVRSRVLLPLMAKGRVIGILTFGSYQPQTYSEPDLEVLLPIADQMAIAVENSRLYQAMGQHLAELGALFEVSGALRGATTVEEMLPIILDKTLEVVAAEAGAIFLVDQAAQQMVVPVARGPMEEVLVGRRLPLAGSVAETVLRTGEPDVSLDLAADPRMPEEMRAVLRGGESGIGLPLRAAGIPVGLMAVSWLGPHTVADDEVRLLTAIADMAASAVNRASLFEQLEHRVHELSALFEVGQAVTATLRIQDVLALVARVAPQAVQAEAFWLFLWDEHEERLVLRAAQGFLVDHVGRTKYRLGEGLSGWVFLEGKVANVPNVAADPRWKRHPEHEAVLPSGQVNSALVVPLILGDKTLGVLGVSNKIAAPTFTLTDESLLTTLAGQMAIALENARLYEDVRDVSLGAIRSLATAIDARDPYTRGHSEGVTSLAVRLARELGWEGADLEMLEFAALLHDVGKIAISDVILRKEGPLTPEEWNVIHLHPYHSRQIVKPVEALYRIVPWIYHHQEKWDGTGYPDGLKGEEIPLASRIIAVADAYNAMTTERPYREARSREEAMEELRRYTGRQFDPQVVEAFMRILDL